MSNEYQFKSLAEYRHSIEPYERVTDSFILPEVRLIARIDAHRLPKAHAIIPDKNYPFGKPFVSALIDTAQWVMQEIVRCDYAYVHGDEISFLLAHSESFGQRRRGKLMSNLASGAAVALTDILGAPCIFDAKLSELPTDRHVVDYFFWQRRVARRNYFSRNIGLLMEAADAPTAEISKVRSSLTESGGEEKLRELGVDPNDSPLEIIRGASLWWERNEDTTKKEPPYTVTRSLELPETDADYLTHLEQHINGPSYCRQSKTERFRSKRRSASHPEQSRNISSKETDKESTKTKEGPWRIKSAKRYG